MTRKEFKRLKSEWAKDTRHMSSPREKAIHPAYQRIIGYGKESLPHIIEDLKEGTDHWFWALQAITGDDPVPDGARGDMERMKDIWLDHLDDEQ